MKTHRVMKTHLQLAERFPMLSQEYLAMGHEELAIRSRIAKALWYLRSISERDEAYAEMLNAALVGHFAILDEMDSSEILTAIEVAQSAMGLAWYKEWLLGWVDSQTQSSDKARDRLEMLDQLEKDLTCPSCHGSGGSDGMKCEPCNGWGMRDE